MNFSQKKGRNSFKSDGGNDIFSKDLLTLPNVTSPNQPCRLIPLQDTLHTHGLKLVTCPTARTSFVSVWYKIQQLLHKGSPPV